MAEQGAREFLEQLCNDTSLRAQYRMMGAKNAADILDFALSKGHVLTESDLREALRVFPEYPIVWEMCDLLKIPRKHPTLSR